MSRTRGRRPAHRRDGTRTPGGAGRALTPADHRRARVPSPHNPRAAGGCSVPGARCAQRTPQPQIPPPGPAAEFGDGQGRAGTSRRRKAVTGRPSAAAVSRSGRRRRGGPACRLSGGGCPGGAPGRCPRAEPARTVCSSAGVARAEGPDPCGRAGGLRPGDRRTSGQGGALPGQGHPPLARHGRDRTRPWLRRPRGDGPGGRAGRSVDRGGRARAERERLRPRARRARRARRRGAGALVLAPARCPPPSGRTLRSPRSRRPASPPSVCCRTTSSSGT